MSIIGAKIEYKRDEDTVQAVVLDKIRVGDTNETGYLVEDINCKEVRAIRARNIVKIL